MFEKVLFFASAHPLLVGALLGLITLAIWLASRRSGKGLSTHELTAKVNSEEALVLDCRDAADFKNGHISDAMNIPLSKLDARMNELGKFKQSPVIVVCNLGQQAGQAVQKLQTAEFQQVYRLSGGVSAWRGENLPLVKA